MVVACCLLQLANSTTTCRTAPLWTNLTRIPLGILDQFSFDEAWHNQPDLHFQPAVFDINRGTKEWQELRKTWSSKSFLKHFGHTLVHTITPFEVARYGPSSTDRSGRPMTVRQILVADQTKEARRADTKNDDTMIFSNKKSRLTQLLLHQNLSAAKWMASQHQLPISSDARSFVSLAQPGKGLPFHKHGKTYLTLVTGTKDWLIAPPKVRLTPQMLWTSNSSNYCFPIDSPVRRVRQHAGEIFYLPEGWWHATINQGNEASLGIVQNVNIPHEALAWIMEKTRREFDGTKQPTDFNNGETEQLQHYLYDNPVFEAEEASHFGRLLHEADDILNNNEMNRSEASALRWTKRRHLWHQQLEIGLDAYFKKSSTEARRPELCLYIVQVAIGSCADRLARESATLSVAEKNGGDFVDQNVFLPQGLTVQKVLDHIGVCEKALHHAHVSGFLGTAAFSASLVELARAIRVSDFEEKACSHGENVKPFSFLSRELKNEKLRLFKEAVDVAQTNTKEHASTTKASVKALWEAAAAVCEQEQENVGGADVDVDVDAAVEHNVVDNNNECQECLVAVLNESPAHEFANELWSKVFKSSFSSSSHPQFTTTAAPQGTAATKPAVSSSTNPNECNYINLIEMVRETNIKNIPSVLQSCMDSLPNGGRTKDQWLNVQDKVTGQTALMRASLEGNLKLVRQLCTCTDIDFELGENFGFIPIDGAAFSGRPKVVQALIQHFSFNSSSGGNDDSNDNSAWRPRWDRPSPVDGYTPLWRAVWGTSPSHHEAVSVLLTEGKADPNWPCGAACDGPYESMLEYAIAMDNVATVKLLLDHGATVNNNIKQLVAASDPEGQIVEVFQNAVFAAEHGNVDSDGTWDGDDGESDEDDEGWLEDVSIEVDGDGDSWLDEE